MFNDNYHRKTADKTVSLGGWNSRLTTVPYQSTFLLFDSSDIIIYKYDRADEEFLPMPVRMTNPIGRGTAILVSLDNFPTTTNTPGLPGKIMFL